SVTITKMTIRANKHTATFNFIGGGGATSFQCALVKRLKTGQPKSPKYGACSSSITYTRLTRGMYSFYIRALGANQSLSTPDRKTFKI
ncbi:MAG: hypothetical protein ACLP50_11090, partial [Solirubrobacteraceae bacterium]